MTPKELINAQKKKSIVYLPVGSMEWHGPHMSMGMDTKNAFKVAEICAQTVGGVVFPPLYVGTETPRNKETLIKVGFKGTENIIGMDFPNNSLKSMYWPPELFEAVMREQLKHLVSMKYRMIVIVNGHGAKKQIEILNQLSEELIKHTDTCIKNIMVLFEDCGVGIGHAGLAETAIMQAVCPEGVDLSELPEKKEKIYNVEFAIVDNETFEKGPNDDYSVRYDPRDATPELGRKLIDFAVNKCVEIIDTAYRNLK